jgi:8-amino-7-oxononanoate synthase
MDLFDKCREFTDAKEIAKAGLYPYFHELQSIPGPEVTLDHKDHVLMLGSNNYMGLASDPRVIRAAVEALEHYGSTCSGSRFLNGTLDLHVQLEERLARFMGKEATLLFTAGFLTNLGIISAIATKGDYILCDRLNHASIFDGCRLSFAKTLKYNHNDMADLERLLKNIGVEARKLIIVDGVFSMEGDLANLPVICDLAEKYNARVMVDEAHGLGVLGKHGRGAAEYLGVEDRVDLIMGTFSKSLASIGGFLAGPEIACHYIKHFSRPLIFTASMAASATGAVTKALEIIENEPERREHLLALAKYFREGLTKLGFKISEGFTPIVPIFVGDMSKTFLACKMLFDEGVYVNPVVTPAVPPDSTMIRTSLMATHTFEQIDRALSAFAKVGKALGLIA